MSRALLLPAVALAAALAATPPSGAEAKGRKMPSYAHAVRCAGLTGAWMREAPEGSKEHLTRFDAALYWGLAAGDVARRSKLTAARMEADTQAAVEKARVELAGADPGAAAAARRALEACVAEVPPLPRKGERG